MKTQITLFLGLLLSSFFISAQTVMNIHQSNGTVLQIPLNTIDSITYTIKNPGNLATISTLPIGNITASTASSGGNISNNGGSSITQRGIVWSTNSNPTTADNYTINGSGTGSFTSNLTGLSGGVTYYVRAYAVNSAGTSYGNEVSFTTTSPVQLATLSTTTISSITSTTAVSGGNVTNNGGGTITSRGVCWSTSANPTTSNNKTTNGSGTGSFTSNLTGLSGGVTYYVRAYAINSAGTSYGNEVSFTTTSSSGIQYGNGVTDIVGNTYQSVIIGNQEWMAENLRTTKYKDGSSIPNVTDSYQWRALTTGAWSHYNNDGQYETTNVYNWYAVNTGNLCPTGWHVPTDAEWMVLTDYLSANGHSGTEGTALKSTTGWNINVNGTDNYGWNGLPGGCRLDNGGFSLFGSNGYWWSSSQANPYDAWYRRLGNGNDYVYRNDGSKRYGFSVRCLRD
jgi:uncharacterized protein (TIGR02145 family)